MPGPLDHWSARDASLVRVWATIATLALILGAGATCRTQPAPVGRVGVVEPRTGDEIMIAGRLVHTGAPVVLWFDPGGYDAYRVENRFGPTEESGWEMIKDKIGSPNRYGVRDPGPASPARGWTLEDVRHRVDQFVLHYDVCGTSRQCFKVLHDERGLSVHFLLDVDGTIYQTLDLKDKAWHATKANDRSVGVEIASIGAYPSVEGSPLADWYTRDGQGTRITFPTWLDDPGVRTPGFIARPASAAPIEGEINGHSLVQYDFTPQQYDSLTKLTAALCAVLPELRCDYPRGTDGKVLDRVMTPPEFEHYRGVLGHWHVQDNKIDPGPAMDWDRVIDGARWLLRE